MLMIGDKMVAAPYLPPTTTIFGVSSSASENTSGCQSSSS